MESANFCGFTAGAEYGYNLALERVCEYLKFFINVPDEVATNENGEPLATSFLEVSLKRIKAAEEYTNLLKLVYPMVNPSMHRRHFLRFIETADIKDRDWIGGYGYPMFSEVEVKKAMDKVGIKFDAYFSAMEIIQSGYKLKNTTI
jgi:hypothetical protein